MSLLLFQCCDVWVFTLFTEPAAAKEVPSRSGVPWSAVFSSVPAGGTFMRE